METQSLFLPRSRLPALLSSWRRQFEVMVPTRENGVVSLAAYESDDVGFLDWYRNTTVPVKSLLQSVYVEKSDRDASIPRHNLPQLSPQARPAQDFVKVDISVPGCPPQSKVIGELLESLLDGRKSDTVGKLRFG